MMSNEWDAGGVYHVCRWCKHYVKGCCTLGVFKPVHTMDVYTVAEDGGLSEVIEETLNSSKPDKLIKALDDLLVKYRVTKARREEVKTLFDDLLPEYNDFVLKERLDEAISRLYQERLDNDVLTEAVEIADPERFYCSKWM